MTLPIEELFSIKIGGNLSPELCKKIDKALASTEISSIPKEHFQNVSDYLVN